LFLHFSGLRSRFVIATLEFEVETWFPKVFCHSKQSDPKGSVTGKLAKIGCLDHFSIYLFLVFSY
jgi:hypothetical protein